MIVMIAVGLAWLAWQPPLSVQNELWGQRGNLRVKKTHFLIELGLKVKEPL